MIVLDDSVATTRSPVPTTRRASASRGAKRPRRAAIRNPARATPAASARAAGSRRETSGRRCRRESSRGDRRQRGGTNPARQTDVGDFTAGSSEKHPACGCRRRRRDGR
jgi:hypothetical protein